MSPEQSLNLVTSHIFYLNSQKEITQISSTISVTFCKICRLLASDRSNLKAQNTQVCLAILSFKVAGITWLISLLRITFTKDHKGFQTPLRITKPGGGGPRIHGSRLFSFLTKTPCAEFHQKMKVYGPVFIIIVLSSPQLEANIW